MLELPLLLLLSACGPTQPAKRESRPMSAAPAWKVYDGEQLVLSLRGEPGALVSTAARPPNVRPVTHPFVSGSAHDAGYEPMLRELLERSTSAEDYVARMRAAGLRVEAD